VSETDSRTVLDLFCGAGGLTLGCLQAGYDVVAGVDADETAIETYNKNFTHDGILCDLAEVDPEEFADEHDIHPDDVDVVGGGPPCQGYSTANLQRDEDDPRNNLVFRFARYVDYYQPRAFVMENVTGIESIDDGETVELLYEDFEASGYDVDHTTLNAADYGVPQKRRRVFFVGTRTDIERDPQFPDPTHAPPSEITQDHNGAFADVMSDD
jgi:DNA (cytosine-5)-methyltransferase 1